MLFVFIIMVIDFLGSNFLSEMLRVFYLFYISTIYFQLKLVNMIKIINKIVIYGYLSLDQARAA